MKYTRSSYRSKIKCPYTQNVQNVHIILKQGIETIEREDFFDRPVNKDEISE